MPGIFQHRKHAFGMHLVETVPLIEHPNEAPVAVLETKQHCHGDRTWSLLLVYQNAEQRHVLSACRSTMF